MRRTLAECERLSTSLPHEPHEQFDSCPLYRIRRVLFARGPAPRQRGWDRLEAGLLDGDPQGELAATWLGKERLREVYAARDLAHARRLLVVFYQHCAAAKVPELTRLARTISALRWQLSAIGVRSSHLCDANGLERLGLVSGLIRLEGLLPATP